MMGSKNIYLKCSRCGKKYPVDKPINLCSCGGPLFVEYDYYELRKKLKPEDLNRRKEKSLWKFWELLPVFKEENAVSLGEGGTPLLPSKKLGGELGLKELYFKDETTNPTGSFKARGLSMAVSKAKELGLEKLIIPSAGNAGSALAAYAARAGLKAAVIMPENTPFAFQKEIRQYGAEVQLVAGSIKECGQVAAEKEKTEDWFSVATLKEPYRLEGKKIMGYELAEAFDFHLPDWIIYPTGGGTGLIGMWKAFEEMEKLGWLKGKKPKMVAVQAEGCAPIVKAFLEGKEKAETWKNPKTIAAGLRVPAAIGDFLMLKVLRESGGTAVTVSEEEILSSTKDLASKEGIFSSPEGGAALAGLKKLISGGKVQPEDRVVVFITGNGLKYLDVI